MQPRTAAAAAVLCLLAAEGISAQMRSGAELYRAACAACHGDDGRGQPKSRVGFETELPDFTDCSFATPEADADWAAIVAKGGRVRAFDRRMPAFGEALCSEEIQRVLAHLRGFCTTAAGWPRGELNLPRPLVTEKAFPENEAVLAVAARGGAQPTVHSQFLYERRLGPRGQFEVMVPLAAQRRPSSAWQRGVGDIAVAFKHVLHHRLDRGTILSAAVEATLPTGSEARGLGAGLAVVEPFAAFGQILPGNGFLQVQAGIEIPSDAARADKEAFWRAAIGRSFFEGEVGRAWSPMVEVLGAHEAADPGETRWDVVPQLQVTLSRRQHVLFSAGVRVPINVRDERRPALLTYLLWDWFDGGIFDGWR